MENETRLKEIDDSKLGDCAFCLYLAIRRLSDEDWVYRGRLGALSRFAFLGKGTIKYAMHKLRKAGLISSKRVTQKNTEIRVLRSWIE